MPIDCPAWVRDAVFYQVFPDRFARSARLAPPGPLEPWEAPPTAHGFKGGDLYGLTERLPELAELGITALYLNPADGGLVSVGPDGATTLHLGPRAGLVLGPC